MALDPEIQAAQDALQAEIDRLRVEARKSSAAAGALSGSISKASRELASLNVAGQVAQDFTKLAGNVKRAGYNIMETTSAFKQLEESVVANEITMTSQMQANRTAVAASLRSAAAQKLAFDLLQGVATVVGSFVMKSLETFASALTTGKGAVDYFNLGAKLMNNNVSSIAKATGMVGDVMNTFGSVMAIASKTVYGRIAGGVMAVVGEVLKSLGPKLEEKANFAVDILNQQVLKMVEAFQSSSNAGAIFANGLSDLSTIADKTGITVENLAAFIAGTAQQMALFGGTVAGGSSKFGAVVKQFTEVDREGRTLREQLGNLGLSIEDQMKITADYLEILARGGRLRGKQDAEIAREAFEYAKSLKVISTITGEDAKAAQKRAKQAFEQSYVQAKIGRLGTEAAAKFQLGVAGMPAELQRAVQQMATEGLITDPELVAAVAQVPALQEMLTRIASGITDQSRSVTDFTADLTALRASLGPVAKEQVLTAAEGVGRANLLLGKFAGIESVFQAVLNLGTAAKEGGEAQVTAQRVIEAAAKTTDTLTKVIGSAESEFQKMATTLQKDLRPAMKDFSNFVQAQISTTSGVIRKVLDSLIGTQATEEINAEVARQQVSPEESPVTGMSANEIIYGTPPPAAPAAPAPAPAPPPATPAVPPTTPTGATTTPFARANNVFDNPVVFAMNQNSKKLDELIEQNKELIRLNTQTARALA